MVIRRPRSLRCYTKGVVWCGRLPCVFSLAMLVTLRRRRCVASRPACLWSLLFLFLAPRRKCCRFAFHHDVPRASRLAPHQRCGVRAPHALANCFFTSHHTVGAVRSRALRFFFSRRVPSMDKHASHRPSAPFSSSLIACRKPNLCNGNKKRLCSEERA